MFILHKGFKGQLSFSCGCVGAKRNLQLCSGVVKQGLGNTGTAGGPGCGGITSARGRGPAVAHCPSLWDTGIALQQDQQGENHVTLLGWCVQGSTPSPGLSQTAPRQLFQLSSMIRFIWTNLLVFLLKVFFQFPILHFVSQINDKVCTNYIMMGHQTFGRI